MLIDRAGVTYSDVSAVSLVPSFKVWRFVEDPGYTGIMPHEILKILRALVILNQSAGVDDGYCEAWQKARRNLRDRRL